MVLLHGNLSIAVDSARGLWEERGITEKVKQVGMIDPYFVCKVGKINRVIKSHPVMDTDAPTWDVVRELFVCDNVDEVTFEVLSLASTAVTGDLSLGWYIIPAENLVTCKEIKGWVRLTNERGKDKHNKGEIHIHVKYQSVQEIGFAPEVPWCYYPPRMGNMVTLYQDAHHHDNELMKFVKANGVEYRHGKCWEEIYEAILDAKHFVYATGWAIYTEISLLRDKPIRGDRMLTNGELFKLKADEGCTVLLMPWDEMLSTKNTMGLMGTHDEESRAYFAKTGVKCRPVMREDDGTSGNWGGLAVGGMWTHHQKSIICDAPDPHDPKRRHIIAFLGGIDITNGRYDYPDHPLFRTIGTVHKPPDFYQNCWSVSDKFGPREPWHDIHMKVEGSAAYDVLHNFEMRWTRQVAEERDAPLKLDPAIFFSPEEEKVRFEQNPDHFVCQYFRSIDERSAVFDKQVPGVFAKKGRKVEATIQRAYVHQIRRATKFLYIENQYFLGSSQAWLHRPDDFALHIIPLEIVQKIISKINADERFVAYILLPLHPEGIPGDKAIQEILYWQYLTIEMMYKMIGRAIKAKGIDAHPQNYLNFFCLGNRETPDGGLPLTEEPPKPGSNEDVLSKTRRCMIYVHSKMMIVDDEYIIIGSANINDRSMAGTRDTEMAMGCYQPWYTVAYNQGALPNGNVACFRKSLWQEHLGEYKDVYDTPESLACVRDISIRVENNWKLYMQDRPVEMKGHLMPYPYTVEKDGDIEPRIKYFPDTKASLKGRDAMFIPDTLTS